MHSYTNIMWFSHRFDLPMSGIPIIIIIRCSNHFTNVITVLIDSSTLYNKNYYRQNVNAKASEEDREGVCRGNDDGKRIQEPLWELLTTSSKCGQKNKNIDFVTARRKWRVCDVCVWCMSVTKSKGKREWISLLSASIDEMNKENKWGA